MRGREPGASSRLCPAGADLCRAVDTLLARGSAAADFFSWRGGLRQAERGCERELVCMARAGAGASPDPNSFSPPPRVISPRGPSSCGVRLEAKGLSPRAPRCLCGGSGEAKEWNEGGCGASGSSEAKVAGVGGAPDPSPRA